MNKSFPELPEYAFSWRSLQVEPIPLSGERITIGAIIKGSDNALVAAKLIPSFRIRKMYGAEFGNRISDAVSVCLEFAEKFYSSNSLARDWTPPLQGFYLNKVNSSVASDIEEGLLRAALHCSSFYASIEAEKFSSASGRNESFTPEIWRKRIYEEVTIARADFASYFDRNVSIRGSGVSIKFGFLSDSYAAQFESVSDVGGIQQTLIRAQSKLWQLDRLRDQDSLFGPKECELVLRTPISSGIHSDAMIELTEELRYEASRRELKIFSTDSAQQAAEHLIKNAA